MAPRARIKTLPALEVRVHLGELMKEVQAGHLRVLVEKAGVPMVGIISAAEFQQLVAEREARFAVVDRIRRGVPPTSGGRIRRDVTEALGQVRRRRRA